MSDSVLTIKHGRESNNIWGGTRPVTRDSCSAQQMMVFWIIAAHTDTRGARCRYMKPHRYQNILSEDAVLGGPTTSSRLPKQETPPPARDTDVKPATPGVIRDKKKKTSHCLFQHKKHALLSHYIGSRGKEKKNPAFHAVTSMRMFVLKSACVGLVQVQEQKAF